MIRSGKRDPDVRPEPVAGRVVESALNQTQVGGTAMKTMRWTHCVGLAAATWLLLACTGFWDFKVGFAPMADAVIVAVALAVFATFALVLRLNWNGWATLLLAAWAAAAASILDATHALMPMLSTALVGLDLCTWRLVTARPPRRRRGAP